MLEKDQFAVAPVSPWPLLWAMALSILFAAGRILPGIRFFDNPADYLPVHTGLEFLSLAVAAMVFALGWNLRESRDNRHAVLLAAAFLYVGLVDFAHTLSFKGMPDFVTPSGPEKAINFWLAARLGAALALLGVALVPHGHWSANRCHAIFATGLAAAAMVWWIGLHHADLLPHTFIAGQGLTPFKIAAEYLLAAVYAGAALILYRRGQERDSGTPQWLGAAAWVLALAEMFFTLYADVTDIFNLLGHVYKVAADWMIYRALFSAGVQGPFRALKREEERLEQLVEARTAQLKAASAQFSILVQQSPNAIAMFDRDLAYLAASDRWVETTGCGRGELTGRRIYDVHRDFPEHWQTSYRSALTGGAESNDQELWIRADGSKRWVRWAVHPWIDETGRIGGIIVSIKDITERRRAEEQLRESEARLRQLSESLPQLVWTCAPAGECDYLSPQWVAYTGIPAAPQLGFGWLDLIHPDDLPATAAAMQAAIAKRSVYDTEFRLRRHDGAYLWFRTRAMPLLGEDGQILKWFGTCTDIDELKQTQESLRLTTERLQTALKTSSVTGFSQDRELRYIWISNPPPGYRTEEILGKRDCDLFERAEDAAQTEAIKREVMATGISQRQEVLVQQGGMERYYDLSIDVLRDASGQIVGVTGAAFEITERKKTELAIRRSEERLRLALAAAHMIAFEHDFATDLLHETKPSNMDLGLTGKSTGSEFFARVHPEDLGGLAAAVRGMLPEKPAYCHEYRFRMPDDSYRWLSVQARGRFDGDGHLVGLLGVCWDVTERKVNEQELKRHAQRQALLLEIASNLLQARQDRAALAQWIFQRIAPHLGADMGFNFRLDRRDGLLDLVAGFGIAEGNSQALGRLAPGRAVEQPPGFDADWSEPDELAAFVRAQGVGAYACHPLLAKDGSLLGIFALGSTRREGFTPEESDFLQTISYFMALAWERHLAEMEIQRLNADLEHRVAARTAELEASNQQLQAFNYAASHDLKSPLGRINSFSALLEKDYRDRLEGNGLLFLDFIRSNATRMTKLIDDLLAHARIERQPTNLRGLPLRNALQSILDEKQSDISENRAEIRVDLPDIDVWADPLAFGQVLRNLVDNALKYSAKANPPNIEIAGEVAGEHCRLWVRDNGIGFDMAYHERIFDIFRRLHTYDEFPGSGVGLALVKKAMERMNGRVWAESQPGQGAVFFLELRTATKH